MESDEMLAVLSACFAPVERDEWVQLTTRPVWSDFLDAVRRALQDGDALGGPASPISRARRRCPLQEFLSAGEVKALFAPPTYDEKRAFAAATSPEGCRIGGSRGVAVRDVVERSAAVAVLALRGHVPGGFGAVHERPRRAYGHGCAVAVCGLSGPSGARA